MKILEQVLVLKTKVKGRRATSKHCDPDRKSVVLGFMQLLFALSILAPQIPEDGSYVARLREARRRRRQHAVYLVLSFLSWSGVPTVSNR